MILAAIVGSGVGCSAKTPEPEPLVQEAGAGATSSIDEHSSWVPVSLDMRRLTSVHVVGVTTQPLLDSSDFYDAEKLESVGFGPSEIGPWNQRSDAISGIQALSKKVERKNCRFTSPSLQVCDLALKSTGRVVGTSHQTGGTRRLEGDFVFGMAYYVKTHDISDHDIGYYDRTSTEWLYANGTMLERTGSGQWIHSRIAPRYVAGFIWDLFGEGFEGISSLEERFGNVTILPDEELEGILAARRYRVERHTPQGGRLTVDFWVDPKTGFPLRVVRELEGPNGTERGTYILSEFNEIELPEVPSNRMDRASLGSRLIRGYGLESPQSDAR